jgi:RNA polymerase II subunit A-like phosphatase
VSTNRTRTQKVRQAATYPHIKIVNQNWLFNSIQQWKRLETGPYEIEIHRDDRHMAEISSADESNDEGNDTRDDSSDEDPEGVMPGEIEDGSGSPIEMGTFDWSSADKELDDFLNETGDSDDEAGSSDTESVASNSSQNSDHGRKRVHSDAEEDTEEEGEGSSLSKKVKMAHERQSALKTVVKADGESDSGLPTPEVTGEEGEDEVDQIATQEGEADEEELDFDDLEAELQAEMEKQEREESGEETG